MDCRLQVSFSRLWYFPAPYSNEMILKIKNISWVFFPFKESTSNFKLFQKKKIDIANVFPILRTVKDFVRPLTKKPHFRTSFDSQHVKGSQTIVKSSWEHFYHIFPSPWGGMIWNISPLLKFQMIGVFVNTWTADYNYPVPDCQNLLFPVQMQLS